MTTSAKTDVTREELIECATETLAILLRGSYVPLSGERVSIRAPLDACVNATTLVHADAELTPASAAPTPHIDVTAQRTGATARALLSDGARHVALLNFANGVQPGGGFLGGSAAQEEALCRCSALYACLDADRSAPLAYYANNAAERSALVRDDVLVSPRVPFFRDEDLELLDAPYLATVLTCAAPDLRWLHASTDAGIEPKSRYDDVTPTLVRRCRRVVEVAAQTGADALVLGAFGCGAFGNDPVVVADAFAQALASVPLGAVRRVVFAVWQRNVPATNRLAFEERFKVSLA